MINDKAHFTFLPLDSRNQESDQIPGFWNTMVQRCSGIFSDHKSNPTRGWDFVSSGLYVLLPVIHINLQVLDDSGGMICSLVDPGLFGDTGIEPTELDL
jgi:hypothetical protein